MSDDDFARVVIAERFALEPRLDPSGTSWLPFPFYFDGAAVALFGQGLEGPRWAALLRTGLGALLLVGAGRLLGLSRRSALVCALIPGLLPTLRVFTVATVPEYFTACLATFASVSLVPSRLKSDSRSIWLGLLCLLLATLSRYEAWPFALAIAFRFVSPRERRGLLLGALCLTGPLAWSLHGAITHGSPWFFVDRVRSYKLALGADPRSQLEILGSSFTTLFVHEPLVIVLAAIVIATRSSAVQRRMLSLLAPALAQLLFLTLGDLLSGAPTHHPERALMIFWTTLPLLGASALTREPLGLFRLRLHRARPWSIAIPSLVALNFLIPRPDPGYADRSDEEEVGSAIAQLRARPRRILIASLDFSYFAIVAAAGSPDRFVAITTGDPRDPSREPIASRARGQLADPTFDLIVTPLCLDPESLDPERAGHFETLLETRDYRVLERRAL